MVIDHSGVSERSLVRLLWRRSQGFHREMDLNQAIQCLRATLRPMVAEKYLLAFDPGGESTAVAEMQRALSK